MNISRLHIFIYNVRQYKNKLLNKISFVFSSKDVFISYLIFAFPFLKSFLKSIATYKFQPIPFNSIFTSKFSSQNIAVYKVVFGNYDKIIEPTFLPKNCDFYIITDTVIKKGSVWKKMNIDNFNHYNFDNIYKNRFFKLHPHLLFKQYKYSLYLDGNIQLLSDPVQFISSIGKTGIAVHGHFRRNCVFDEISECIRLRKDNIERLQLHEKHLFLNSMPIKYGMAELPIILREHNNATCIRVMDDWWYEFLNYSKRDQISFPYVLFKNDIKVKEVTTLGEDIYSNYSFKKHGHRKFTEK